MQEKCNRRQLEPQIQRFVRYSLQVVRFLALDLRFDLLLPGYEPNLALVLIFNGVRCDVYRLQP